MIPAIFGLAGLAPSPDELRFFRDAEPAGYILFRRNCADRAQLRALTDTLRANSGRDDLPILIDQEGGRVARLAPPEWPPFPAAARFGELYGAAPMTAIEAARLNGAAIAALLAEVGITVDCAPLLDLRHQHTHAAIGDRAFGAEPMQVAALGRAMLEGLAAGGVAGMVKHLPGQGRAASDSHVGLPQVDATEEELARDLEPFRSVRRALVGMMAHVVYSAWDRERCASRSPAVIADIVRGRIGFEGLLLSDDIGMEALSGSFSERARDVVEAGCDIALHCSGALEEMIAVASALGEIGGEARGRLDRVMASTGAGEGASYEDLAARRNALLACA